LLDFILIVKRHHLELAPHDILRRDACLGVASQIVDNIEVLAETGELAFLQDTASCMTSSLGVLLRKMFRPATLSQKALIISLLQRLLMTHTRVSGSNSDTATAYVARFIRRLLGAINSESRAESRAVSPQDGADLTANPAAPIDLPDFMLELEQFMQMPESVVPAGNDDSQYWAMLFSAGPANNDYGTGDVLNQMMGNGLMQ